ncbi:MAG: glycoside hydrolase family 127 protein, partial [Muribaculaceae bacterium]|nr:glycoside hydrolase family 127 protein [Muribaculaceae bacterium]
NSTTLSVKAPTPVKGSIKLRHPSWAAKVGGKVNGRRVKTKAGNDGYITLSRTWRDGDRIEMTLDMSLRLEPLPGDATQADLFYGPVLLAGDLGTEGMQAPAPHSDPALYNDYYTYDYGIPEHLKTATLDTSTLQQTVPLRWQTPTGITVTPLYDLHRTRHVIYWHLP